MSRVPDAEMPINLALYSDQIVAENSRIDIRLIEMLVRKGRGKRFGYMPSGPDPERRFFRDRQAYYASYGIELDIVCDLDAADVGDQLDALFRCDAIHLSGGHTGGFLARLLSSGALERLRDWACAGGVLVGTSAGAILMTPDIAVDALFTDGRPEEVRDGAALDLVPFEFFPHLNANSAFLPKLVEYSRLTARPIIACRDGDGIVVDEGRAHFIGQPLWIKDGAVKSINETEQS